MKLNCDKYFDEKEASRYSAEKDDKMAEATTVGYFGSQEINLQTGQFAKVPRILVQLPLRRVIPCNRRSDGASRRDAH